MPVMLITPTEMAMLIAQQAKAKRLARDLAQRTLAERSGVSLSVVKKFEQTGKISLGSLLKIALTLGALEGFKDLFPSSVATATSLDELMQDHTRKRGRR